MPNVYTPETLAERWCCSAKHIRNLIATGDIAAFRLGEKLLRIRGEAVEEFERDNEIGGGCVEELSPFSVSTTNGSGARMEPLTRAKLRNLRQRYRQD